jgi:hypothetical protein
MKNRVNNESSLSEDIRAFAQQIKSLHNMAVVEGTEYEYLLHEDEHEFNEE